MAHRGDYNNIGPRLSLVWDVRSDAKSVVRAGYGLYHNPVWTLQVRPEVNNYKQASITIRNPSYPDPYGGKDPLTYAFGATASRFARGATPCATPAGKRRSRIGSCTTVAARPRAS